MQLSASPPPGVVDARPRGHDVAVGKAPGLRYNLIAVALVAGLLGSAGATAQDRSDAMLRAFQDACFPQLTDLPAQRKRIVEAGFVQHPRAEIPGLDLNGETIVIISGPDRVEKAVSSSESYRRERDGFMLLLSEIAILGTRHTQCSLYDLGVAGAVDDKKLTDWIGRRADESKPVLGVEHRSMWTSRFGALPGGYEEIVSEYRSGHPCCAGANLATAASAKVP
jgi:hypothetical protein